LRRCLRAWEFERVRATLAASLCLVCANFGLAAYGQSAYGEEVPRLTFAQLVDSIRANFEVTQTMKSFNGKEVEIHGFIVPAGPPDLSFFLLSRVSAMGNYCCEVPVGQDETVHVYAPKGVKILYDPLRVYKVRGAFEAGPYTDPTYGTSLFRVRNARVEEAVGAKIFKVGDTPAPTPSK
jgi:hypothetical protein